MSTGCCDPVYLRVTYLRPPLATEVATRRVPHEMVAVRNGKVLPSERVTASTAAMLAASPPGAYTSLLVRGERLLVDWHLHCERLARWDTPWASNAVQ